jgi:carbamoyltransferase
MTAILGISGFYHDSAAAIVVDGRIVAAAQEERFSRTKNDARFPSAAIEYCLHEAGLTPGAIDYVAFYEKPLLKFDRVLETWCSFAPRGFRAFRRTLPSWLKQKLYVSREIRESGCCSPSIMNRMRRVRSFRPPLTRRRF